MLTTYNHIKITGSQAAELAHRLTSLLKSQKVYRLHEANPAKIVYSYNSQIFELHFVSQVGYIAELLKYPTQTDQVVLAEESLTEAQIRLAFHAQVPRLVVLCDQTPFLDVYHIKELIKVTDEKALLEALAKPILPTTSLLDQPFLMVISDIFSFRDRGRVVTGRVLQGKLNVHAPLELVGSQIQTVRCIAIERMHRPVETAQVGELVVIFLQDSEQLLLERGQVLALPNSLKAYDYFEAEFGVESLAMTNTEQSSFYLPQLGSTRLNAMAELVSPVQVRLGENVIAKIRLSRLLPLQIGYRFALHAHNCLRGFGIITSLAEGKL